MKMRTESFTVSIFENIRDEVIYNGRTTEERQYVHAAYERYLDHWNGNRGTWHVQYAA